MTNEKIMEIRDLSVGFSVGKNRIQVLHNINMDIYENEVLAVIGETGCGKSVTGSTILRILPENAMVQGEIWFRGKNILEMDEEEFRRLRGKEIASVPQSPSTSLDPLMRVGEQVRECVTTGKRQKGEEKKKLIHQVKEIFQKLKLPEDRQIYDQYPCELSGGMKQRILLAMGVATSPHLLVIDEPTKAIDWALRKEVVALLKELKEEMKCSMLFITHDLGAARIIADRIAVMYCGEVVETGPSEQVLYHPRHPYTKGLISSMPSMGMKVMEGYMPSFSEKFPPCRFQPRCPFRTEQCQNEVPRETGGDHRVRCHQCTDISTDINGGEYVF